MTGGGEKKEGGRLGKRREGIGNNSVYETL
jgi:hypothetical protein